jgi:hypothetical protein
MTKVLNAQQDGHRTAINPMSFGQVPKTGGGTYDKTECVKDNVTGLIWEGKTASGTTRAVDKTYTNYDSHYNGGSDANITAASNSMGYVKAVNDSRLCGFSDWRLPTRAELGTLVDYSQNSGPLIDTTSFPNTAQNHYWTASPYVGNALHAWFVGFYPGAIGYGGGTRSSLKAIRLVRDSQ